MGAVIGSVSVLESVALTVIGTVDCEVWVDKSQEVFYGRQ